MALLGHPLDLAMWPSVTAQAQPAGLYGLLNKQIYIYFMRLSIGTDISRFYGGLNYSQRFKECSMGDTWSFLLLKMNIKNKNCLTLGPKQRLALKAFVCVITVYVFPQSGLFLESTNTMFANRMSASNQQSSK